MMKFSAKVTLFILLVLGCQSAPVKPIEVSESNQKDFSKQFENLKIGHFEAAWNGFKELRKKPLNPAELDLVEVGEARVYFLLGDYEKSIFALKSLLERDLSLATPLRRQIRFYLADALEEVGNLTEALASLQEIMELSPTAEELFILKVRQVSILIKLNGNLTEIEKKKADCDELYQEILATDPKPEWLSQILFESSWTSQNYFKEEHYEKTLSTFQKWNQKWKARALQVPDNKWAQVSLRHLQLNLKDLWEMSLNPKVPSKMEPRAAELTRKKLIIKRLNALLELIQLLELEFSIPFPNPERPKEVALFEFIEAIKSQAQSEIDMNQEQTSQPERKGKVKQDLWQNLAPLPEANL
jgi:tetratricopeptide (TPR) repeat protein